MPISKEKQQPHVEVEHHKTIFDGWRSMAIALYMALLGYSVSVSIPVIASAWVSLLGFTDVQVGRVAGADLGGLALGSVIASLFIAKYNRRYIALVSAAIAILANVLCMYFVKYEEVLWLRLLAGTAGGAYTAIAIVTLGATVKPARAFNYLLFAFAFTQAAEIRILPMLSMNGIYMALAGLYVFGLFFIRWLPTHAVGKELDVELDEVDEKGQHHHIHKPIPKYVPFLALLAILVCYTCIGAFWTYIDRANISAGIDEGWINDVLTWGSFMSLVGCLVATVLSDRFGMSRPLLVALLVLAWTVNLMASDITDNKLLLSVFMFNFLWVFIDVYQMGSMSVFDPSGKYVSLIPCSQGLGQIIGPNLAASILAYNMGFHGVFTMCSIMAVAAMLIYGAMYLKLKKVIPALADAS